MEVVVTTSGLLEINQHPVFLQAGCPSCRPTNNVKALKGKYHIPWTCLPQAHLGLPTLSLTTNSAWLPWGGLPRLSSASAASTQDLQEAQLMMPTGSTRLAVSRGQQTWYHSTCNI